MKLSTKLMATLGVAMVLAGCSGEKIVLDHSEPPKEQVAVNDTESTAKTEESLENTDQGSVVTKNFEIVPEGYTLIEVDGGDMSGYRQGNVVVDIGFGDREYWAYTNEHGQLVRVIAKEIIIQDDANEPVKSNGRYYNDEAKVPGVESDKLDEGHIIADSLGGVSNAYNITPQESTLNRHGDQAYMEENIRKAGGATDFLAEITYPDTETQIPSHYEYTYTINGNTVTDSFDNINPDDYNESLGLTTPKKESKQTAPKPSAGSVSEGDVSTVDANGNGKVTVQEAKDAGISLPLDSSHWLYQYMDDRDGDGLVGE